MRTECPQCASRALNHVLIELHISSAKAAMSGAANSHLWAVTEVAPSLSSRDMGRAWGHAGPVCSAAVLTKTTKFRMDRQSVYSFDAPSSTPPKSWLLVARGASARLQLVGHLGWVHQHEASPVLGQPRERM